MLRSLIRMGTNDKYRIFLIFLDFIFIDLLEWMVSKCQKSVKKEQFRSWPLYVLLEKRPEKKFGQFFGRFHREGASSFFGSDPPRVFHFPWGGGPDPPRVFHFPWGGVLGCPYSGPPPRKQNSPAQIKALEIREFSC